MWFTYTHAYLLPLTYSMEEFSLVNATIKPSCHAHPALKCTFNQGTRKYIPIIVVVNIPVTSFAGRPAVEAFVHTPQRIVHTHCLRTYCPGQPLWFMAAAICRNLQLWLYRESKSSFFLVCCRFSGSSDCSRLQKRAPAWRA